jgi:hypothetical protein
MLSLLASSVRTEYFKMDELKGIIYCFEKCDKQIIFSMSVVIYNYKYMFRSFAFCFWDAMHD